MELTCEAGTNRSSLDNPSWALNRSYTTDFHATNFEKGSNRTCLSDQPGRIFDAGVHLIDYSLITSTKGIIAGTVVGTTPRVRLSSTENFQFRT